MKMFEQRGSSLEFSELSCMNEPYVLWFSKKMCIKYHQSINIFNWFDSWNGHFTRKSGLGLFTQVYKKNDRNLSKTGIGYIYFIELYSFCSYKKSSISPTNSQNFQMLKTFDCKLWKAVHQELLGIGINKSMKPLYFKFWKMVFESNTLEIIGTIWLY